MKVRKILSIAIFSALLASCSSSGGSSSNGGGGNIIPPGPSSLNSVPQQYRSDVNAEKTIYFNAPGGIGTVTLDGKTDEYNFANLPNGTNRLPISISYQTVQGTAATASGTMLVYQQPYSVVVGETWTQDSGDNFTSDELNILLAGKAFGFATPAAERADLIAENAIFEYKGVAFDGKEEATLNYTMLFGQREGHGSIAGFAHTGLITLWAGQIGNDGFVRAGAHLDKDSNSNYAKYELSFFGPNAEEIAGKVHDVGNGRGEKGILGDSEIIFAGTGKNILSSP